MSRRSFLPVRCSWLAALAAALSISAFAAPIAEVANTSGVLMSRKPDGTSRIMAPKSRIESGELLATGPDSYARIRFTDGGEITLRPNTQLRIDNYVFDRDRPQEDSAIFSLLKGGLRTITGLLGKRRQNSYEMRSITATVGIRGTGYSALACQDDCGDIRNNSGQIPPNGDHIEVFQEVVTLTNLGGTISVSQGQFAYVSGPSTLPLIVPPEQGVTLVLPDLGKLNAPPGSGVDAECVVQ